MQKIARLQLRKYKSTEIEPLIASVLQAILGAVSPLKVFLFGSAVGENFDDASDLDFLVIFPSLQEASEGQKKLYRLHPLRNRTIDFVCVDWETFLSKSEIGGVCFEASRNGRLLYG